MQYNTASETRSLYIHWPFCPYKCHFCPFVALAGHDQFMAQYHSALMKEIEIFAQKCDSRLSLDTVFLGGGTPSTYPNDLLLDMSGTLRRVFIFEKEMEMTIEVNPGTVSIDQLAVWKEVGINRLSIGVQSLKDSALTSLNRLQTTQDVYWLLDQASALFDNISVDLIVGLPGVTVDEFKDTVRRMVQTPIVHISVYFLTIHEDTQLYFRIQKNTVTLPADDQVVDSYLWMIAYLKEQGFEQYELSNFARPGYRSKHNTVYWERKPYKGFGIGACSFDGTSRFQNQKNLMNYMNIVANGEDATIFSETLTSEQMYLERIMLGLRRAEGVDLHDMMDHLSADQRVEIIKRIESLHANGFVEYKGDRLRLTTNGLVVQNEVTVQLSL